MKENNQSKYTIDGVFAWLDAHRLISLIIIITICFAVYGIINFFIERSAVSVSGTISLNDTAFFEKDKRCEGTGGYSDITEGAQVKVSDGSGNIVAISELKSGKGNVSGECIFDFNVESVPYSNIYQFEVSKRGEVSYSRQKLVDNKYHVDLQLGD